MRKVIFALAAISFAAVTLPMVSAPASAQTVVIKTDRDHDRGLHRGWNRGHHYGWNRGHRERHVVIVKKHRRFD